MSEYCSACGQALPADGGTLGNLIRARRIKMHLSLRDVERISNGAISNAYLSQIETGKVKDPASRMLLHISAALCLDIHELMQAVDPVGYEAASVSGRGPVMDTSKMEASQRARRERERNARAALTRAADQTTEGEG